MSVPAISLLDVSLGWRTRTVLREVSGVFPPGSMTAVVGANGAGKSTLLKAMAGLIAPLSGVLHVEGDARDIAWLPQAASLDRSFPLRVIDLVAMGAWRRVGAWDRLPGSEWARAQAALEQVGLADCAARSLFALSGGQMQRVLFARLLMQDASVMLLDEPFAAMDGETTGVLLRLMQDWHAQGRTVVAVSHDLSLVRRGFPQALLLAGRVVAWGKTAEVLSPDNLAAARGGAAQEWL